MLENKNLHIQHQESTINSRYLIRHSFVPSLTRALNEYQHWMQENYYEKIGDVDGQLWSVKICHYLVRKIKISITTKLSQKSLVTTKIYGEKKDKRLLELIGKEKISICLRPEIISIEQAKDMKKHLICGITRMKKRLECPQISVIKKQLISRWIEQKCSFRSFIQR